MENPADVEIKEIPLAPDATQNEKALLTEALSQNADRLAFVKISKVTAQQETVEIVFNCRISSVESLTGRFTDHLNELMRRRNSEILAENARIEEERRKLKLAKK